MDTKDTKDSDPRTTLRPNPASHAAIACALTVHTTLGPGCLESTYSACFLYELRKAGLHVQHQARLPVTYDGVQVASAYRVDFIVENCLLVEIKCVEKVLRVHVLLINFNVPHLRDGIRRVINGPESEL